MKIMFVLPGFSRWPVGGYKVVYEYANQLVFLGHDVAVCHRSTSVSGKMKDYVKLRRGLRWMVMDSRVKLCVAKPKRCLPDADVVIATAYQTAYIVADLLMENARKYQLIQHYEVWAGNAAVVDASWRLPLQRIVIAKWLKKKATELQSDVLAVVPNAFDHEAFRCIRQPGERAPNSIFMLWHDLAWKGSQLGLEILQQHKFQFPDAQISFFGTPPRPATLPAWIHYHQAPSLEELVSLYNAHSIFLSPSQTEGWPLPPMEAMACGCCVVSIANQGIQEYARHEDNAVLVDPDAPMELVDALRRVVTDHGFRQRMAENALTSVKQYTYERSTSLLLKALSAVREEGGV